MTVLQKVEREKRSVTVRKCASLHTPLYTRRVNENTRKRRYKSFEESNLFFYGGIDGLCKDVMRGIALRFIKGMARERGEGEEEQIFPKFDIRLRLFKQNEWLKKVYFEG